MVRGGVEPPTFRFSGAYAASLHVAGCGLMGDLAAQTMAGCRPMWPDVCRRWLPVWLPLNRASIAKVCRIDGARWPNARHPAPTRAADPARLIPIARRGRRGPGSWPTAHGLDEGADDAPKPIAVQTTAPGHAFSARCRPTAAAVTAATGIGQGAQLRHLSASSPAGTDSAMFARRARREVVADRYHAAGDGYAGEGERCAQQRTIWVRPHAAPRLFALRWSAISYAGLPVDLRARGCSQLLPGWPHLRSTRSSLLVLSLRCSRIRAPHLGR